jgi:hypothetical protein
MFNLSYEERLSKWREFREQLESSSKPINDVVQFYSLAPTVSIHTDPYNEESWPGPWELLHENQYCSFCKILGMCYTLQLTESFNGKTFEIIIGRDIKNNTKLYLLSINKEVIGLDDNYVHVNQLPESIIIERNYSMPELQ